MSIASEITRLQDAKTDIIAAISNKGIMVPSNAKLDDLSQYIDKIGKLDGVYILTEKPTAEIGNDGDIAIVVIPVYSDLGTVIPKQSDNSNIIASNTKTTDGTWYPYYAFDEDYNTAWSANNYVYPAWIAYDFGVPVEINAISIMPRVYSENTQMRNFAIEASNDRDNWTPLTSIIEMPNDGKSEWYGFIIKNNMLYRFYRLYIYDTNGQTITIRGIHLNTVLSEPEPMKTVCVTRYKKSGGQWNRLQY